MEAAAARFSGALAAADRYPALFSPAEATWQLFRCQRVMWGWHTASGALINVLGALDGAPDDAATSSSAALAAG